MSDEQDQAESLDDDKFGGEYPPDKLMGAQAYGAAGAEPHADENITARAARDEPEEKPEPEGYPDGDGIDDVVQEMEAPIAAEEAAMHTFDESLGGFDSEVDDQSLEDAWEVDPEVER